MSIEANFRHLIWIPSHINKFIDSVTEWMLWDSFLQLNTKLIFTLSPLSTTYVPYAKSLDLGEMPSNSASHPDPSCLTIKTFLPTLRHIEALWKMKQTRSLADGNLFGGLRVKRKEVVIWSATWAVLNKESDQPHELYSIRSLISHMSCTQ